MTKEQIQTYTLRVSQASACGLVVILYDIILEDIETATAAKEQNRMEQYREDLRHAGLFVNELINILDFSVPISKQFLSLYTYATKKLAEASASGRTDALEDVTMIISKLRAGFAGIEAQDTNGPMMQNAQQVYAGLTYGGTGSLQETYLNPQDYNRGYRA